MGPGTLNFSAPSNSTAATSQTFSVQSTLSPLSFQVSVQYEQGAGGWLSLSATSGTTPASIIVTVNPTGLVDGTYQALIGVQSGTQGLPVQVTLLVAGNVVGGTTLVANPPSVILSTQTSLVQTVQVSDQTGTAVPFNVFTETSNAGNWLVANPTTGTTPASVMISANTSSLVAGSYTGAVSIYPSTGGSPLKINVQLFVGTGGTGLFIADPALSFNSVANTPPAPQSDPIFYAGGTVQYSATASVSWIQLTSDTTSIPAQSVTGNTGTNVRVMVNPTGLAATTYQGMITVTAAGLTQTISVTLTVGANGVLFAQPSTLFFGFQPGGSVPAAQTVTISTNGTPLNYATSANSTGWLHVSPGTGSTPGQITVSVTPSGLANGTYQGLVTVSPVSGSVLAIPVTLKIGTLSSSSLLLSLTAIPFQTPVGVNPPTQPVSVRTATGSAVQISATASSSGGWLTVTPALNTTPSTLLVSANVAPLPGPGSYVGSITVTNLNDGTQAAIDVTLTVTGAQVGATPSSLAFTQVKGTTLPPAQTVQLISVSNSQVSFNAATNVSWLHVTPAAGTTPVTLSVTVDGSSLAPGSYSGAVIVTGGAVPLNIPVTLALTSPPTLTATPGALKFTAIQGSNLLLAQQTVSVTSSGASVPFTVVTQITNGGNWLSVSASATATPATLTVAANPAGLGVGSYSGTITITGSGGANQVQAVAVTLAIVAPTPSITSLVNAASLLPGAVAPGEIITIKGNNLGPTTGASGVVSHGVYETSVAGTQLTFDGVAAPLLYVSAGQINAVAPYALANRTTTTVQVTVNGAVSSTQAFQVAPSAPGVFTLNATGSGPAAVINQDGTVNGPQNPAPLGSIIAIYATGEGQTTPAGEDGKVIGTDLRMPMLPVTVKIGGVPAASVPYAGSAPGFVSGALQVNVLLDSALGTGSAVPVQIQVGDSISLGNATIAIKP